MAKFIVVKAFDDSDDELIHYPVNALYPREGYSPTEERVLALSTRGNALEEVLIKPLIELPPKDATPPDGSLDREAIKAQLDAAGISYAKNAKTETLLEILEASKLGE